MNRNVTIVVVILVLVVIAGYLVWLRSKIQTSVSPTLEQEVQVIPTAAPSMEDSSPSAEEEEATGSMKEKTSTGSSSGR